MTAPRRRFSELLAASGVHPPGPGEPDPEIRGAAMDSRRVEPENLFLAVRGREVDGTRFVGDAIARGARAVVTDRDRLADVGADIGWARVDDPRRLAGPLARECYGRPDESMTVTGVTGTNGKTTLTWILESIARAAGRSPGRIGTTGYAYAGCDEAGERTTPEAPDLYRLLDRMRDHAVDFIALEVSSHALSLERVGGLGFDVAAFLNLTHEHLDFHGSVEAYFEAKASLFARLAPGGTAVIPADGPWAERLRPRITGPVLRFGRSDDADVRIVEERADLSGTAALLATPTGRLEIRSRLLGEHNVENLAAGVACALAAHVPSDAIVRGLDALPDVPGRMERVDRGQPFAVVVDYAHTPAALAALLRASRAIVGKGRVVAVFGCGGARDRAKRPEMGRIAATLADLVVLTSDNPRHEDPEDILDDIASGIGPGHEPLRIADRARAIREAVDRAVAGDLVAIAGKGHETHQTVGDRRLPFDDREVASRALAAAGYRGGEHADA